MTCAKVHVEALLMTREGAFFRGTNGCAQPQVKCPRYAGEGYAKCKSVCEQEGHAETVAMDRARLSGWRYGGTMFVDYKRICDECLEECHKHGLDVVVSRDMYVHQRAISEGYVEVAAPTPPVGMHYGEAKVSPCGTRLYVKFAEDMPK